MSTFGSWLKSTFQRSMARGQGKGKPITTLKTEELKNAARNGYFKSLYKRMKTKFGSKKTKVSSTQSTRPVSLKALLGLDVPKLEFGFLDKCEAKERNVLEFVADIFADEQLINYEYDPIVCLDVSEDIENCNLAARPGLNDEEANDYDLRISLSQEYKKPSKSLSSGTVLDNKSHDNDNSDMVLNASKKQKVLYSKQSNASVAIKNESGIWSSSKVLNKRSAFNGGLTSDVFLMEATKSMDSSCTTSQGQNDQYKPSIGSSLKSIEYYDPLLDPNFEGIDLDDYVTPSIDRCYKLLNAVSACERTVFN